MVPARPVDAGWRVVVPEVDDGDVGHAPRLEVDSVYILVDTVYVAGTTSRELLVDTARAHLDEHGLEGLTLREIARRAGVSHGAPLRHFASLAALCSAVATQGFRQLYADIAEAMEAAGPDGRDRLCASGQAYVRFAVANPGPTA